MRRDAVAAPTPRTLGEVADRLQRPGSVALALRRLPLPALQTAEALAALDGRASGDALASVLGATSGELARGLDAALQLLVDHALVWPDGAGELHMAASLRQAWDFPLGLEPPMAQLLAGATSEELRQMLTALGLKPPTTKQQRLKAISEYYRSPERITSLVAQAPSQTRRLLERRARSAPKPASVIVFGAPSAGPGAATRWALERGLLVQNQHRYGPDRMPAEVALALRGPDWHAPFEPTPSHPGCVPVTSQEVETEAAAAATAFCSAAASILAECATRPPTRLKAGGVGARELARIGKAAKCDEPVVRLTLESAYTARLLANDGDRVPVTEAYDTWAEAEPAERLAELLRAWASLSLTPTQSRDEDGKALPSLAGQPPCYGCLQARDGLLSAAARLPAGEGVKNTVELGPLIRWNRPLADELPHDATPFATLIREAELLGMLARGALSPLGIALLADDTDALLVHARRLLPPASGTARIGADLTAVVTGAPSARLAALLNCVADREASGTASVWRFSPGSIRRALDAGRTGEDLESELAAIATGPLPQPLSYLITDTARRHGHIRITAAACVIHGSEPALLAELAAHRKLTKLGLRQLAPTVVISCSPLEKTMAALRTEGYAPMAETPEGTVRIERTKPPRASAVPHPRHPRPLQHHDHHAPDSPHGQEPPSDLQTLAATLLGPESRSVGLRGS